MLPPDVSIIGVASCEITEDDYVVLRLALSDGNTALVHWPVAAIHAYASHVSEAKHSPNDVVMH